MLICSGPICTLVEGRCKRCGGNLWYERFWLKTEFFDGFRCLFCGDILDPVIWENREYSLQKLKEERLRLLTWLYNLSREGEVEIMGEKDWCDTVKVDGVELPLEEFVKLKEAKEKQDEVEQVRNAEIAPHVKALPRSIGKTIAERQHARSGKPRELTFSEMRKEYGHMSRIKRGEPYALLFLRMVLTENQPLSARDISTRTGIRVDNTSSIMSRIGARLPEAVETIHTKPLTYQKNPEFQAPPDLAEYYKKNYISGRKKGEKVGKRQYKRRFVRQAAIPEPPAAGLEDLVVEAFLNGDDLRLDDFQEFAKEIIRKRMQKK